MDVGKAEYEDEGWIILLQLRVQRLNFCTSNESFGSIRTGIY
jgi:hypothetical protein